VHGLITEQVAAECLRASARLFGLDTATKFLFLITKFGQIDSCTTPSQHWWLYGSALLQAGCTWQWWQWTRKLLTQVFVILVLYDAVVPPPSVSSCTCSRRELLHVKRYGFWIGNLPFRCLYPICRGILIAKKWNRFNGRLSVSDSKIERHWGPVFPEQINLPLI